MWRCAARSIPFRVLFPASVAVLLCGGPVTAYSASAREICIGAATGPPGARVSVPLVLDSGEGLAGFQVDVRFDPALLSPVGARPGAHTAAAGGWTVDSAAGVGTLRVIGNSFPPVGLQAGFNEIALLDFDIVSGAPVREVPFPLANCVLGDSFGLEIPCRLCLQPGVEGAWPRFARSLVDDGPAFGPARLVIEQGDWALWRNVGTFEFHTTTSGAGCVAGALWDAPLEPGQRFVRRFLETPGTLPYFCRPHCPLGMVGDVLITDVIRVSASLSSGSFRLTWEGGSGLFEVIRSDHPAFVVTPIDELAPDGGPAGTSFTDPTLPAPGTALYYLVINAF
jgi:hypothetical protein